MLSSFALYSEISTRSLDFNPKKQEAIDKKVEIVNSIIEHHDFTPKTVLFCGFNPLILTATFSDVYVCNITDATRKWLLNQKIKFTYISNEELSAHQKKFDWTIALDEYFTFADSELEQKNIVEELVKLTNKTLITTLRDYKNSDYKDREFSYPLAVHNNKSSLVFLEYHRLIDRNSWETMVYEIQGDSVDVSGPFPRSSMFFKQLAKFSIDAGAKTFYVHKNLMYKSLIRKNYEHVISINI